MADINANFSALNASATATTSGLVPTPPNDTTKFLRGDATWATGGSNVTIVTAAATTLSLTTTAGQKVIVWAKGNLTGMAYASDFTVSLKYNGVTKDTVDIKGVYINGSACVPFSTMYTETPGAATQNITVTTSAASLANVVIIAQIIG